jgi:quercetin dioxygenase-like cupin family protein
MISRNTFAVAIWIAIAVGALGIQGLHAQESKRTEIQRHDLTGTNMEVIMAVVELPPGAVAPRHFHFGEEVLYVLSGGTAEMPDGKKITLKTGSSALNVREVPHAGFKITGKRTVKLITVHIVDKGKPLSTPAP